MFRQTSDTAISIADLRLRSARYDSIIGISSDGIILYSPNGLIIDVNNGYCRMSGYTKAEICLLNVSDLYAPECPDDAFGHVRRSTASGSDLFESVHRRKDGTRFPVEVGIQHSPDEGGQWIAVVRDITERKKTEEALLLTQITLSKIADAVIWLSEQGRYVHVNDAACRLLGYSREELASLHAYDVDPLFDEDAWKRHWREVETRESFTIETINRSKSGVDIPIEVTVNFVEYGGKKYNCSIVRDITERKKASAEMAEYNHRMTELSNTDGLTCLSNRRHFDAILTREIERQRRSGAPLSLILLDIDHFKSYNDHHGHLRGDECLKLIAGVMRANVRRSDDLAARFGGEEFVCILPTTNLGDAVATAERIRRGIVDLGIEHRTSSAADVVTASFGVHTVSRAANATADEIIAAADECLYRAKREGRNRVVYGETRERIAAAGG